MAKNEEMDDVFNLDGTAASSYLENKAKKANDGILRPKLEEGKDGVRELVIRFLPNLQRNGKLGPSAVEKHVHYADFKQNQELQGYFDCLKNTNIGKECPLCTAYWALINTKDPKDEAKAKLINRGSKHYAYVYIVEDTQVPENEGKIMIYPYGYKILQKIKSMKENKRNPCKVEDLVTGANFVLKIEEVGGYYNYDGSMFETPGPIEIGGKKLKIAADGSIDPAHKAKVIEFLKSREHDLDEYVAKDWTEEQHIKVNKIINFLSGTSSAVSDVTYQKANPKTITSAQIFGNDEDDDKQDETPVKSAKNTKVSFDDDEDVPASKVKLSPAKDVANAKSKAAKFFDDDED